MGGARFGQHLAAKLGIVGVLRRLGVAAHVRSAKNELGLGHRCVDTEMAQSGEQNDRWVRQKFVEIHAQSRAVRGAFRFNTNHFGIQNFYMEEVVKGADGKPFLKLGAIAMKDHGDAYAGECHMQ